MKKIALQLLMLVMALAVSQTSWADGKEKRNNGHNKPNTEHRGFAPGQQKKFDKAKWDSIKAAHPNFGHRMDSLKAHRPMGFAFGHRPDSQKGHRPMGFAFGHRADSLKGHRPAFGPRFMPMHRMAPRFGMRPPFGHHRFGPRPGWHRPKQMGETVAEEVKVSNMEETAITETRQNSDAPAYDLNGRKATTQKGIVIRNGKKYVK